MTDKNLQIIDGGQLFERYSSDLVSFDYDTTDARGMPVVREHPLPDIDANTKLIPEPHCHILVAYLEAKLVPANEKQAHEFVRRVLGRFGQRDLVDPDMFVIEMKRVFTEAPPDLGAAAVKQLRPCRFMPNVGDLMAVLEPLVQKRKGALRQVRLHLAEHERRAGKSAPPGELSEKIGRFMGLKPAIEEAVGEVPFQIIWKTLWLVLDDGTRMVLAQPTRWLRDMTVPHLEAIGKVADRVVELVIRQKPAAGFRKPPDGPRPIGDVLKGN